MFLLRLSLGLGDEVEFSVKPTRKLLWISISEGALKHINHQNDQPSSLNSKIMILVVPAMVIFSCAFSCFRKRKEASHTHPHKDAHSMDSASSFEVVHSTSEKVQASPRRFPPPSPRFSPRPPSRLSQVELTFNEAVKATQNFSSSCCIGEGGFGMVYKGRLQGGQEVAIKRARKELFDSAEFNSEVEILSKISHHSLVRLLGIIDKGNERLIVTEYVSNGTLRQHLDGDRGKFLDFNQRLEIALDVAHGLTYLHMYAERQIIHRDVKSSNILLTDTMKAKVADFGFARVGPGETDRTHISTKVKGTVGYLDPDYMRTYQLTTKSDVYSYGILLLEILTGRRPVEPIRSTEERVLIKWSFYKYNEGDLAALVDPTMGDRNVKPKILRKMFELAIHCAAPVRTDRPDMKDVVERLWAIRMEYNGTRQ